MNTNSTAVSDTVVLIHGLWMTPRGWEKRMERYKTRGLNVLAPAYPGLEVEQILLDRGLGAAGVDFDREDRAPLLFIAGGEDHFIPPALNKSNARHYNTGTVAYKEFPGRCHFTLGQDGWEQVADYALEWAFNPKA